MNQLILLFEICEYAKKLLDEIEDLNAKVKNPIDLDKVKKGIYYARKYHGLQMRQSGDPYKQCELLNISRSTSYYKAKDMRVETLSILNRIDEIYTDNPEFGYRYIHQQLLEDGFFIGKERVLKYMI